MNLFILDLDPEVCARYHVDKHVVKMILETAQLLSTAHRILDDSPNPKLYRITHQHHPCARWVRESRGNYDWAYNLFERLCDEYTWRYDKTHLTSSKLRSLLRRAPRGLDGDLTPFALAMPDEFKCDDPVESYRAYYRHAKRGLHKWTHRRVPEWI